MKLSSYHSTQEQRDAFQEPVQEAVCETVCVAHVCRHGVRRMCADDEACRYGARARALTARRCGSGSGAHRATGGHDFRSAPGAAQLAVAG